MIHNHDSDPQKAVSPSAQVPQTPNNLFQTHFKSPVNKLVGSLEGLLHLMSREFEFVYSHFYLINIKIHI